MPVPSSAPLPSPHATARSTVLLTGASGFLGQALARHLAAEPHWQLRCAVRHLPAPALPGELCSGLDLHHTAGWNEALKGIDCVVHCAARVHVMQETAADPLTAFRSANRDAALRLARLAVAAGVRRFVFVSTLKVNGEATVGEQSFHADDRPQPLDPYGISKHEAEQGLRELAAESGLEVVIVRPPLVYGPGVKANFLALLRALARGLPLPLASVTNRRSLVYIDNLVDFIALCCRHPAAANQTFLVSDGEDLSTPQLLHGLAAGLGRPARLLPCPPAWLRLAGRLLGKTGMIERLLGSLAADIEKNRDLLSWTPPVSASEGLRRTAAAYRAAGTQD
ncbi:SDR family oxidoreductase [Dechloromonas sp. ZY10]|uniref:UDP-glucose 4-epimerase family protein n=1 Tax=Dechloromonas aquae TaxID=2664436 RepID=UPI00352985CA